MRLIGHSAKALIFLSTGRDNTMADIGYDSSFGIYDGTSAYDLVAEVTASQVPGFTRDTVETTHLKSTDAYQEFIAGLKDMSD